MKHILLTAFALLTFGLASRAQAYPSNSDLIRCDSVSHGTFRCEARGFITNAHVVRQHSNSACIYGRTWGYDQNSVWVSNGCRATFEVYYDNGNYPPVSCGRYNASLSVPPRAQAWVSLGCPSGCRLAQYGYYGTNMGCNWNINYVGATLTCFNPNPYYYDNVPQVYIDCMR